MESLSRFSWGRGVGWVQGETIVKKLTKEHNPHFISSYRVVTPSPPLAYEAVPARRPPPPAGGTGGASRGSGDGELGAQQSREGWGEGREGERRGAGALFSLLSLEGLVHATTRHPISPLVPPRISPSSCLTSMVESPYTLACGSEYHLPVTDRKACNPVAVIRNCFEMK